MAHLYCYFSFLCRILRHEEPFVANGLWHCTSPIYGMISMKLAVQCHGCANGAPSITSQVSRSYITYMGLVLCH